MKENITRIEKIEVHEEKISFYIYKSSDSSKKNRYVIIEKAPYEEDNGLKFAVRNSGIPLIESKEDNKLYQLSIDRFMNGIDRIYNRFYVFEVCCKGEGRMLDGPCYITHLNKISKWDYDYPKSHTIKGLQVKILDDGLNLGIGHVALNMNLPCIIQSQNTNNAIVYKMENRDFYFNKSYIEMMDSKIKAFSDRGIVVNLIIINRREWYGVWGDPALDHIFMHPGLHPEGVVSAFYVTSQESLTYYKACLEFLSERYMCSDGIHGRACGLIIGNEVNSQWIYSNAGEIEMRSFIREYLIALRTAYYAAKKYYAQARIYVSLDHCWNLANGNNPLRYYKGLDFINTLNQIAFREGDFYWCMAYHPFPEDLSRADFWNDKTAWDSFDTGKITFKNIEVLPDFFAQEKYLYNGIRRRIILSEQGLCSGRTLEDEAVQADAYVLAYRKISCIPEIDSFIYHSHIDEKQEGLYLGLLAEDGRRKAIYDRFVEVDGSQSERLYRAARARVGEENCRKIKL